MSDDRFCKATRGTEVRGTIKMNLDVSECDSLMSKRIDYLVAIRTYYHYLIAFSSFPPFSFARIDKNRT